jgi:hypothetical protein
MTAKNKSNAQTKSDHAAQGRPERAPTLAQGLQQAPRGQTGTPRRSLRVLQGFALACGSPQSHRVTPRGKTQNPREQEPHCVSVQGFALDTRSHPTARLYRQEGGQPGRGTALRVCWVGVASGHAARTNETGHSCDFPDAPKGLVHKTLKTGPGGLLARPLPVAVRVTCTPPSINLVFKS